MKSVNPVKKLIIKTSCLVHKVINEKALELILKEGFEEQYNFYKNNINKMNAGTVWADQDFKSTNHFFHFKEEKGLFGFSNALVECTKYFTMAIELNRSEQLDKSLFYFGAACHLVQDATVPQHVNNRLLNSHRNFELWIMDRVVNNNISINPVKIKSYEKVEDYIKENAKFANIIYEKYNNIEMKEERYESIATKIIEEAVQTTAGIMLDFYKMLSLN
jgi:phospholipase C